MAMDHLIILLIHMEEIHMRMHNIPANYSTFHYLNDTFSLASQVLQGEFRGQVVLVV